LVSTYEHAIELVPASEHATSVLEMIVQGLGERLPATAARLDAELRARDPLALAPRRRAARATLLDLSNEETWCIAARAACVEEALSAARSIREAAPELCEGHELVA